MTPSPNHYWPARRQCRWARLVTVAGVCRDVTLLARRVLLPGELRCICAVLQTTTDDDDARRQRPLLVWPLHSVGGPVIKDYGDSGGRGVCRSCVGYIRLSSAQIV